MASTPKFFDRVQETSTTTGTGTYTLAGAVTGFQTFAAVGNGNSCYYCAFEVDGDGNPSGGWEVGVGTFTSSGTTLSRDKIIASSNSNNAVSWAAGTRRIFVTAPAVVALPSLTAGGRLTTESGVPVSTSDRSAQSTIYYTPYIHNRIALWDGNGWREYHFAEVSLALSGLTSGKNYDVFLYDNAGTLTLELSAAWTNDTTRADALTTQDGVFVKSGSTTRRHIGTIRTSGTTTTEDTAGGATTQVGAKRFVWNRDNRVQRSLRVHDTADSWSYNTASYRVANGATAPSNCVEWVAGDAATFVELDNNQLVYISDQTLAAARVGIGIDSDTPSQFFAATFNSGGGIRFHLGGGYRGTPGLGYHQARWVEYGGGDGTVSFIGDDGGAAQYGLRGVVIG